MATNSANDTKSDYKKKNLFDDFLTWFWEPNPDTTLVNWLQRKRARDRQIAEKKHRAKIEQKIKAEKEYRKSLEREAYLLWEADGKPEGKDDYYWTTAIDKITEKDIHSIYKLYYWLEKRILEPTEAWVSKQALFSILERLGYLVVLVALIEFIGGQQVRRNNEVFTAWQTITSVDAEKQSGSGGRKEALEFLNSRPWRFPWIGWTDEDWYWDKKEEKCKQKRLVGLRWERQSLNGVSVPNAYLQDIHLCGADLLNANLSDTILTYSDLTGAKLTNTKLSHAQLGNADLRFTHFGLANLWYANMENADLRGANLEDITTLRGANLKNADLKGAKNLIPSTIKSACNWEEAKFDSEFEKKLEKEADQEVNCKNWKIRKIFKN